MFCFLPPTEAAATLLADTGCSAVIEGANSPCTKAVSFTIVDYWPWQAIRAFAFCAVITVWEASILLKPCVN